MGFLGGDKRVVGGEARRVVDKNVDKFYFVDLLGIVGVMVF